MSLTYDLSLRLRRNNFDIKLRSTTKIYLNPSLLNAIFIYLPINISQGVWKCNIRDKWGKPSHPCVVFHVETSHLFVSLNQMSGFYVKRNPCLKWVKAFRIKFQNNWGCCFFIYKLILVPLLLTLNTLGAYLSNVCSIDFGLVIVHRVKFLGVVVM